MAKKSPKTHIKFQMVHGQKIIMNPIQIRPCTWAKKPTYFAMSKNHQKPISNFRRYMGKKSPKIIFKLPLVNGPKKPTYFAPIPLRKFILSFCPLDTGMEGRQESGCGDF